MNGLMVCQKKINKFWRLSKNVELQKSNWRHGSNIINS